MAAGVMGDASEYTPRLATLVRGGTRTGEPGSHHNQLSSAWTICLAIASASSSRSGPPAMRSASVAPSTSSLCSFRLCPDRQHFGKNRRVHRGQVSCRSQTLRFLRSRSTKKMHAEHDRVDSRRVRRTTGRRRALAISDQLGGHWPALLVHGEWPPVHRRAVGMRDRRAGDAGASQPAVPGRSIQTYRRVARSGCLPWSSAHPLMRR